MELLDQHFPGKSCGNTRCENLCRNLCAAAIRLRMSPEELVNHGIQKEIVPHFGCEKALVLSDKYPNSQNYPNKGKPIPGCRFGYTYGSHPPKSDDQLEAQKKSSKTSASSERWKKTKEQASNAVQAVQTSVETVLAPPGAGELSGAVKAGTLIVTELPIQAKYTKRLVAKLEEKTGETRLDLYFQIQDCISKQDFKRLLTIQGKLKKQLKELEKQEK
jgi:hypothetical protein